MSTGDGGEGGWKQGGVMGGGVERKREQRAGMERGSGRTAGLGNSKQEGRRERALMSAVAEAAVYALLNLSVNDENKWRMMEGEILPQLIHVLQTGTSLAREGCVALLFSLSALDELKAPLAASGAVPFLMDTLVNGTAQGRADALLAIHNLALHSGNKGALIRAGVLRPVLGAMRAEPTEAAGEKGAAVVAALCTRREGVAAVVAGRGLRTLTALLEAGSPRAKEHAAAALLLIASSGSLEVALVWRENVAPLLLLLSQSVSLSSRARTKAFLLLQIFASHPDCTSSHPQFSQLSRCPLVKKDPGNR